MMTIDLGKIVHKRVLVSEKYQLDLIQDMS